MLQPKMDNLEGQIVAIRLVSGEELLATYVSENEKSVVIKNALKLHIVQDPKGQPAVGLQPFSLLGDLSKPGELYKNLITFVQQANQDAKAEYQKLTSGLILPNKNLTV